MEATTKILVFFLLSVILILISVCNIRGTERLLIKPQNRKKWIVTWMLFTSAVLFALIVAFKVAPITELTSTFECILILIVQTIYVIICMVLLRWYLTRKKYNLYIVLDVFSIYVFLAVIAFVEASIFKN